MTTAKYFLEEGKLYHFIPYEENFLVLKIIKEMFGFCVCKALTEGGKIKIYHVWESDIMEIEK